MKTIHVFGKIKTVCERVQALDQFYLDALKAEDENRPRRQIQYRWRKYRTLRDSKIPRRLV